MQAYEVIAELAATSSKTEKEAIVTRAFEAGCTEFFEGARLAYDVLVTFGIKQVPEWKTHDGISDPGSDWLAFESLTGHLRNRTLTGDAAKLAIQGVASTCTEEQWTEWYRRVLMKDLKCGATESTINKALKALVKAGNKTAERYIIPVFSCQLAHPRDKFEKLMAGDKLVDIKLDGVRIIAVCDVHTNTVTLHTRNGRVKENFPQIQELLKTNLIPYLPYSVVVDGEMVSRTFNQLMSQLNRQTNVDTSDAKFAIFDVLPLEDFNNGKCSDPQHKRDDACAAVAKAVNDERVFHVVKTKMNLDTPEGMKELDEFHIRVMKAGYEGTMVKDPNAPYVTKRSNAWLKMKPWVTVDLPVVGMELGEKGKKYEHCLGRFICEGVDEASGLNIKVNPGTGTNGSLEDQDRVDFWARRNEIIGKTIEIIGHEISKDEHGQHSVRHPRFVRFRDDK
jgi:DNA ligase-1